MLNANALARAIELRRRLHECPERSGHEARTKETIAAFLREHTSLEVRDMGAWLLASHVEGAGLPAVGLRADMDALPLEGAETGARHGCGHDGHSAVLCGVALALEGRRVGRTVHLIFQGAEETGEGAKAICEGWDGLGALERVYALHNIPGFPRGAALVRRGCFACASCGLSVRITGRPAHAAYPGDGANPIELLSRLALETQDMIDAIRAGDSRLLMRTLIGLNAGGDNFGLSASEGRLNLTLRGHRQADVDALIGRIKARAEAGCAGEGMSCALSLSDVFPDTTNDDGAVAQALPRLRGAGLEVVELNEPMRWSEDFGWFLKRVPGMYFGIGAGEDAPGLHTAGYSFDDALIEPGVRAFMALIG